MSKTIVSLQITDQLDKDLEWLKNELGISKSDIIREALKERVPQKIREVQQAKRTRDL